jgi:hypothetical protein
MEEESWHRRETYVMRSAGIVAGCVFGCFEGDVGGRILDGQDGRVEGWATSVALMVHVRKGLGSLFLWKAVSRWIGQSCHMQQHA